MQEFSPRLLILRYNGDLLFCPPSIRLLFFGELHLEFILNPVLEELLTKKLHPSGCMSTCWWLDPSRCSLPGIWTLTQQSGSMTSDRCSIFPGCLCSSVRPSHFPCEVWLFGCASVLCTACCGGCCVCHPDPTQDGGNYSHSSWKGWLPKATDTSYPKNCPSLKRATLPWGWPPLGQLWRAIPGRSGEAFVVPESQFNFSFCSVLLPSLPHGFCCQEHPPVDTLQKNLHLRNCFLRAQLKIPHIPSINSFLAWVSQTVSVAYNQKLLKSYVLPGFFSLHRFLIPSHYLLNMYYLTTQNNPSMLVPLASFDRWDKLNQGP